MSDFFEWCQLIFKGYQLKDASANLLALLAVFLSYRSFKSSQENEKREKRIELSTLIRETIRVRDRVAVLDESLSNEQLWKHKAMLSERLNILSDFLHNNNGAICEYLPRRSESFRKLGDLDVFLLNNKLDRGTPDGPVIRIGRFLAKKFEVKMLLNGVIAELVAVKNTL